jgi:hypothetical protein
LDIRFHDNSPHVGVVLSKLNLTRKHNRCAGRIFPSLSRLLVNNLTIVINVVADAKESVIAQCVGGNPSEAANQETELRFFMRNSFVPCAWCFGIAHDFTRR